MWIIALFFPGHHRVPSCRNKNQKMWYNRPNNEPSANIKWSWHSIMKQSKFSMCPIQFSVNVQSIFFYGCIILSKSLFPTNSILWNWDNRTMNWFTSDFSCNREILYEYFHTVAVSLFVIRCIKFSLPTALDQQDYGLIHTGFLLFEAAWFVSISCDNIILIHYTSGHERWVTLPFF